jgi:DNA mismatch repair protein MutS
MAGKSTYLRQVALITLLAQIGCFVPARKARIGLVDRIFTRVGAEDDIAAGKSTFMVEMEETATILHHATNHSLIVLDEIGRGTSTYDGLAIARAVVEYLHNTVTARTLFATHYHELAGLAAELPHMHVYTMAINEDEEQGIVFLHRVMPGSTGKSFGVHVARLAGMPSVIVQRAGEFLRELEAGNGSVRALLEPVAVSDGASLVRQVAESSEPYRVHAAENKHDHHNRQLSWQSEEARAVALVAERAGRDSALDTIDVNAITPIDALNLLALLQKRSKHNSHE